jgi:hypothetical protein
MSQKPRPLVSVIGERFDGPKQELIYLPPDLLIDASPKSEPVSS